MPEHLLTTRQMKEAEEAAIAAGTPASILMERAGAGVASAVQRHFPDAGSVLVFCGPGNNGGDGFVTARLLAEAGLRVEVVLLGRRDDLAGEAEAAAARWTGEVAPVESARPDRADVVVDALFGSGLSRAIAGDAWTAIEHLNGSGVPVVAVDIPSGIDGNTGEVRGIAVRAARTVTFAARKLGHVLMPGRAYCGLVEVAGIGIDGAAVEATGSRAFANSPDLWHPHMPRLEASAHKYERGHTLVCSGGATRTGAARLVARAALRIGSGLVTVASPPEALGVNAAQLTAIMLRGCDGPGGLKAILEDRRINALVLGPALGVHAVTRAMVGVAVGARRSLVLDADALTSFEGFAPDLKLAFRVAPIVLTPHEGEFSRLFKGVDEIVEAPSKLERARAAAAFTGATIVLKGADTVVASPDGEAAVNENGTPYLATAGSGDVLCGVIAGLMAQGLPAFRAACAGVWIHAEAGASFGPGLIAEDLPELLPQVLGGLLM
jgi:NAD(P)H-hydrate epimerase